MGLRCPTVRVSDHEVRHLISTGYLSLESSEATATVANRGPQRCGPAAVV
jgi:hypothetical protein